MDEILTKMQSDLLEAMKSKDQSRVDILKLVISAIKTKQIDAGKDIPVEEVHKIIQSNIKAMKEAAEQYKQVGSKESAEKELTQVTILEEYLPDQLGEAEIEKLVTETITETGASGAQDMGRVMGAVMGKVSGQADGGMVQNIVKKKLQ